MQRRTIPARLLSRWAEVFAGTEARASGRAGVPARHGLQRRLIPYLAVALVCFSLPPSAFGLQKPPILPDPKLTPGATLNVTAHDICQPGYSKKVRNVPESVKKQVYAEYGIKSRKPGEYEVDHLISLELGGSNSIKNLWPQSYKTKPWNAHVKDKLENRLHALVCSGQLDLKTAQRAIATNWIAAYTKYMGSAAPAKSHARRSGHAPRRKR
jgi:hypothetical protein